jgi:hypothetical protein
MCLGTAAASAEERKPCRLAMVFALNPAPPHVLDPAGDVVGCERGQRQCPQGAEVFAQIPAVVLDGAALDAGQVINMVADPLGDGDSRRRIDLVNLKCLGRAHLVDQIAEPHRAGVVVERQRRLLALEAESDLCVNRTVFAVAETHRCHSADASLWWMALWMGSGNSLEQIL